MIKAQDRPRKVVRLYKFFSNFLYEKKVNNRFFIEIILNDVLYKYKYYQQDLFSIDTVDISGKFNISIKQIRTALNWLIKKGFLTRVKRFENYDTNIGFYYYKINFNYFFQVFGFSCLDELYVSRASFIPLDFFTLVKTKKQTADIKAIFLFCDMFQKNLKKREGYCLTLNDVEEFLECSRSTAKRCFKKLQEAFLIYKEVVQGNWRTFKQKCLKISICQNNIINLNDFVDTNSAVVKTHSNLISKNDLKDFSYVDKSVDKSLVPYSHFEPTPGQNGLLYIYKEKQEKNIDSDFGKSEKIIFGVGGKKTPPPSKKSIKKKKSRVDPVKLGKKNRFLKEKGSRKIESTKRDVNNSKNIFKMTNKQYTKNTNFKSFDELIPTEFNSIEYENFIYRIEKLLQIGQGRGIKYSSDFIKKLIKKLTSKYSHYKFKNLELVEKYFVKVLLNEKSYKAFELSNASEDNYDLQFIKIAKEKIKKEQEDSIKKDECYLSNEYFNFSQEYKKLKNIK